MVSSTSYTTKQWILATKPTGAPVLSGPDATFKLQTTTLPPLKEGQILCKVQYFSNDTGIRNFVQSTVAPERLYVPTVPLGSPMRFGIIAEVLESASPTHKPGDLVMDFHLGTWSELVVLDAATSQPLAPLPNNLPLTHYLGAFGASGLAAYTGLVYAGGAKPGDTIVISAAAGATGSMAVQIAVQLLGAQHKSLSFAADLKAVTLDEVDVYLDNVGGEVLDTMLTRMKCHGTVAVCGAVSGYNSDNPMALKNWFEVVSMGITIRGFIMLDYMDKAPNILQDLIGAAADGRIKLQNGQTVVEARIEEQPEIWMRLFSGRNQGKLLTKLIV